MNNRYFRPLAVLLAVLLLIFGNAVNSVRFCCDECRAEGPDVLQSHSCHIHEAENDGCLTPFLTGNEVADSHALESALPVHFHQGCDGCSMSRLTINMDDVVHNRRLLPSLSVVSLAYLPSSYILAEAGPFIRSAAVDPPPILSGRDRLMRICVMRH